LCFFVSSQKKKEKKKEKAKEEESRYLVLVYGEAQIVDLGTLTLLKRKFIFSLAKGMW
jgi:hypothetical protein